MQIIFWHKKAFCALTPQLRQIHLTNSRHFDESWVSGVTITGNNDINYNGMLRAKLLFYESFWKRKWASSPPASVVREERSPRSLLMSRWVEANSGSWVSDFSPRLSTLQRTRCYRIRRKDGVFVCSWLLRGVPWRKVTKLSSPCHLSLHWQSLSLTQGTGGKRKKSDNDGEPWNWREK